MSSPSTAVMARFVGAGAPTTADMTAWLVEAGVHAIATTLGTHISVGSIDDCDTVGRALARLVAARGDAVGLQIEGPHAASTVTGSDSDSHGISNAIATCTGLTGSSSGSIGADHAALLDDTIDARRAAWSTWGSVDEDVLTLLLSPERMGGPPWPSARQAFRLARRPGAVLLASDGLSDPFDDSWQHGEVPRNGFEVEFYAATADNVRVGPGSWLWDLVWEMSQFAADRQHHSGQQYAGLIDELGLLSTELFNVGIPQQYQQRFINAQGRVGVLLGLGVYGEPPSARIDGPLSPIRLVNVKLLTVAELAYAIEHRDAGRAELARRFAMQGDVRISTLDRTSVIL
jgi:hypothetical protein